MCPVFRMCCLNRGGHRELGGRGLLLSCLNRGLRGGHGKRGWGVRDSQIPIQNVPQSLEKELIFPNPFPCSPRFPRFRQLTALQKLTHSLHSMPDIVQLQTAAAHFCAKVGRISV